MFVVSWSGDWQHCKFGLNQSLFMFLHVNGEAGQETVNHGCTRNTKEHVGIVNRRDNKVHFSLLNLD